MRNSDIAKCKSLAVLDHPGIRIQLLRRLRIKTIERGSEGVVVQHLEVETGGQRRVGVDLKLGAVGVLEWRHGVILVHVEVAAEYTGCFPVERDAGRVLAVAKVGIVVVFELAALHTGHQILGTPLVGERDAGYIGYGAVAARRRGLSEYIGIVNVIDAGMRTEGGGCGRPTGVSYGNGARGKP